MDEPAAGAHQEDVRRARRLVAAADRVVVLSGAGISTDSGIPDFRGPQGVWTRNPAAEKASQLGNYLQDPEARKASWRARLVHPAWEARPNPGHIAVAELERQGKLHALVTQNTDGLHELAGTDPARIVEIHGTMRWVVCWSCGDRQPMQQVLDRVRAGEADPSCQAVVGAGACGGILKSATILFGQSLVAEDLMRAEAAARSCDLLLAVGSSLGVYPAAGLVPAAYRSGAPVVIVNAEPTPYDDLAEAVVRGSISDALPAIVGGAQPDR